MRGVGHWLRPGEVGTRLWGVGHGEPQAVIRGGRHPCSRSRPLALPGEVGTRSRGVGHGEPVVANQPHRSSGGSYAVTEGSYGGAYAVSVFHFVLQDAFTGGAYFVTDAAFTGLYYTVLASTFASVGVSLEESMPSQRASCVPAGLDGPLRTSAVGRLCSALSATPAWHCMRHSHSLKRVCRLEKTMSRWMRVTPCADGGSSLQHARC